MKRLGMLVLLVLPLSLAAQDQGKTVQLTEKQNKEKVALKKGDILLLKLQALPGAGYTWQLVKNDNEILEVKDKGKILPSEKKVIGGPQMQLFRFEAKKAGTSQLELQYKRPWEKDVKPTKIFRATVNVE